MMIYDTIKLFGVIALLYESTLNNYFVLYSWYVLKIINGDEWSSIMRKYMFLV